MNDAHTFDLCRAAVAASSVTAVAAQLIRGNGRPYSRTAISLYLSGKYGAGVDKLEAAIVARYDIYPCPHTGIDISGPDCHRRATAPRPFGGRAKEAHWMACQTCQHNKQGAKS
jgi:hypothetical protein